MDIFFYWIRALGKLDERCVVHSLLFVGLFQFAFFKRE